MNLIFDLDGTLIDASDRLYQLFQDVVSESHLTKEEYWKLKRDKVNHKMLLERFFSDINFDSFNNQWMNLIEDTRYLNLDVNYADTISVLESLAESNRLVLLTARQSKDRLYQELDRLRILRFFETILVTEGKRDKKELLKEAIDAGKIEHNSEDMFISDMGKDILIGKNLNYITIGITHGFMNKDRLVEYAPDYIVDELSEIDSLLIKQ